VELSVTGYGDHNVIFILKCGAWASAGKRVSLNGNKSANGFAMILKDIWKRRNGYVKYQ